MTRRACSCSAVLAALEQRQAKDGASAPPPPSVLYLYECLEYYLLSGSMSLADAALAARHVRFASQNVRIMAGPAWSQCVEDVARDARAWEARERRQRRLMRMRTLVAYLASGMRHRRPPQLTMTNPAS